MKRFAQERINRPKIMMTINKHFTSVKYKNFKLVFLFLMYLMKREDKDNKQMSFQLVSTMSGYRNKTFLCTPSPDWRGN